MSDPRPVAGGWAARVKAGTASFAEGASRVAEEVLALMVGAISVKKASPPSMIPTAKRTTDMTAGRAGDAEKGMVVVGFSESFFRGPHRVGL